MSGCDRGADAVGHAFSALEPDEDRMVLEHLPVCRECRRVRDEALEIVAVLGAAVPADEPPPACAAVSRRPCGPTRHRPRP